MKLSELMSSFDLAIYPTIGLLGFTFAFVVATTRIMVRSKSEVSHQGSLPLNDGSLRDAERGERA
ncbi:MAG: hypothetical protein AAF747_07325 [Planctomycetota bacterium]